jgi:EAL domain-containing protein (putative c-di-GMP-specific phosphodiesterase class I)
MGGGSNQVSNSKLVIIDDDPFLLKVLNLQLRNLGLRHLGFDEVAVFERSEDALAAIETLGVDQIGLIFCDLQMPGMDGVELLRHLGWLGYRGGIVLVSGAGERVMGAAEQLCKAHGLNLLGSIDKPVTPERLGRVIECWAPFGLAAGVPATEVYTEAALRTALEAGELVNYYQPIVSLSNGKLSRFEVLLRWKHPLRGVLPPSPILDAIGDRSLRRDACDRVVGAAIEQAAEWRSTGGESRLALNFSLDADDLELDFPERLEALVQMAGLDPSTIGLEISFAHPGENLSAPLEVLARLRLKRFRLSLDRFGTAAATLELLRDIPVDEIKVDGGLVRGAAQRGLLAAMLASTLDLARRLELDAAAVAIEDRDDWDLVRRLGYDYAQGFFIGAPMPAADVEAWRRSWELRRVALTSP